MRHYFVFSLTQHGQMCCARASAYLSKTLQKWHCSVSKINTRRERVREAEKRYIYRFGVYFISLCDWEYLSLTICSLLLLLLLTFFSSFYFFHIYILLVELVAIVLYLRLYLYCFRTNHSISRKRLRRNGKKSGKNKNFAFVCACACVVVCKYII